MIATRCGASLMVALAIGFGCGGSTDNARENSAGTAGSSGTDAATGGTRAGQNGTGGNAGSGAVGGGGASGSGGAAGVSTGGSAGTGGGFGATGGQGGTANGSDAGSMDAGPADLCDYPPETGFCLAAITRFYFDPGDSQCREFTWGGCGGNANNFETREACEAACEHRADTCIACVPAKGCAGASCAQCPPRADADGQPCSNESLACTFGPSCGGVTCGCTYVPSVGRVWRCSTPPC